MALGAVPQLVVLHQPGGVLLDGFAGHIDDAPPVALTQDARVLDFLGHELDIRILGSRRSVDRPQPGPAERHELRRVDEQPKNLLRVELE